MRTLIFSSFLLFGSLSSLLAQPPFYGITNIAGPGDPPEAVPAAQSSLRVPVGLARDKQGNLYIADMGDNRVRKITAAGVINTIAGNGLPGSTGDGGQALQASVTTPYAVAVDAQGNVYIADGLFRIRKVDTAGVITTFAGTGIMGFSGDGGPATQARVGDVTALVFDAAGNLYFSDNRFACVRKISVDGVITTVAGTPGTIGDAGDNGPATLAVLTSATGLAIDSAGTLYVSQHCRIRSISNGTIRAYAGVGACATSGNGVNALIAYFNGISGLYWEANRGLYVAQNTMVRLISPAGLVSTFAGTTSWGFGGDDIQLGEARFDGLGQVIYDPARGVCVADGYNHRVRCLDNTYNTAKTLTGAGGSLGDNGPAAKAFLRSPTAVAVGPDKSVYVADIGDARVRKISPSGVITTVAGNGTYDATRLNVPATSTACYPLSLAVNKDGLLYIGMDDGIYRIQKDGSIQRIAGDGTFRTRNNGASALASSVMYVYGMAFDANGVLYFSEWLTNVISRLSPQGQIFIVAGQFGANDGYDGDNVPATTARFAGPRGIWLDAQNNIYIADADNHRIRRIDSTQTITTVIGNGSETTGPEEGAGSAVRGGYPTAIAGDAEGNLFFTDQSFGPVRRLGPTGRVTALAQNLIRDPGGSPYLFDSTGLALSPDASLWVTSRSFGRVLQLTPTSTPPCTYQVQPSAVDNIPHAGATGELNVLATNGCAWTVTNNSNWVTLGSPNSGTGNGKVPYTVLANTGAARQTSLLVAGITVPFSQKAYEPPPVNPNAPQISTGGVVDAAGYRAAIAPLSYVSIYGRNFAPAGTNAIWDGSIVNGALPKSLAGVRVKIGGQDAYVYTVSAAAGVVNVLVPSNLTPGTNRVELTTADGTATADVLVKRASPTLFAYLLGGTLYPSALFANSNTYVNAPGAMPGIDSRAARAGDYLVLFGNGLGETSSPVPDGQVIPAGSYYTTADLASIKVSVGGVDAEVLFAGMTFTGLWQINIRVPPGVPAGLQPVVLTSGAETSQANLFLPFAE